MRPVIMKGDKVSLSPVEKGDARRIYELFVNPEVRRFIDAHNSWMIPNELQEEEFVNDILKNRKFTFPVIENSSGELIGLVSLMKVDTRNGKAELGYWIGRPYWGKGYGTEAAKLAVEYGFKVIGLRKIYAYVYEANEASKRILEKLGFKLVGRLRQHLLDPELGPVDLLVYDLFKEEWEAYGPRN